MNTLRVMFSANFKETHIAIITVIQIVLLFLHTNFSSETVVHE